MDPTLKLLFFLVDLVLPLVVGYLARRHGWWTERFTHRLMMGDLLVVLPILIALSVWTLSLSWEMLWLPVMGVVMQLVPWGVGYWRAGQRFTDPLEKGAYLLSCMFSNRGVVGILTVFVLYGEQGYALGILVMFLARPMLHLVGFPLSEYYAQKSRTQQEQQKLRWLPLLFNLKQVPTLGIFVGLALNLSGMSRPVVWGGAFDVLVHVMAWGFVLPLGYGLDMGQMRGFWRRLGDLLAIKFLITPLVVWLLVLALPLDPMARNCLVILSFSPTAINAVIAAKLHGLNTHLAMAAFILTTLVYMLVLLPLFLLAWG